MKTAHRIGANVRRLRGLRGLTQNELAEMADIAGETVSRIERNRFSPSLDIAQKLALALGARVDDLMKAPPAPTPSKLRPSEARFLHLVKDLDEPEVREIVRCLQTLFRLGLVASSRKS